MAPIRIDSGPIDATQPIDEIPRERWRELLSKRRGYLAVNLPSDCRYLLRFVTEADSARMWEQTGHANLDDLIKRGLELDPRDVQWALDGLRSFKPDEAVCYEDAIKLGKRGRPKKGEENVGHAQHYVSRTTAYYLARLDRDDKETAARVRAGELTANAAAEQKGWRKRPPSFSVPLDIDGAARALRRRFNADDCRRLAELLVGEPEWPPS